MLEYQDQISFSVCEASTKFKQATVAHALYVNKVIKNAKNSKNAINFRQLNLSNIKLQLFTYASFNNLRNGGSQAGQITFLTDDKSSTCPLYWNSFKIRRVVKLTITVETVSLSEGCDVTMYISKLVSELFHDGKQLNIITYCIHWQPKPIWCCTHFKTNTRKVNTSWYNSNKRNGGKKWNQHYMDRENQTNEWHPYKSWNIT